MSLKKKISEPVKKTHQSLFRLQFTIVILLSSFLRCDCRKFFSFEEDKKPEIDVKGMTKIAELHSNLTIQCKDEKVIEWWTTTKNDTQYGLTNNLLTKNLTKDHDGNFRIKLILQNIKFTDMNLYICVRKTDVAKMQKFMKENFDTKKFEEVELHMRSFNNAAVWKFMSKVYVYVKTKKQGAPKIFPNLSFIKLEKNQTQIIRCEADEPIFWKSDQNTTFKTMEQPPTNLTKAYTQTLILENVTADSVASYYCIKVMQIDTRYGNDVDFKILQDWVRANVASRIHVYVNDEINLIAPIASRIFYTGENEDLIIPCRPVMPGYVVRLFISNNRELCSSENYSSKRPKMKSIQYESLDYDSKIGFLFERMTHFNEQLFCKSSNGHVKQIRVYYYYSNMRKQHIYSDTHHLTTVGATLKLSCVNKCEPIVWIYPPNIDKARVKTSLKDLSGVVDQSSLTIDNVQKSDAGTFSCRTFVPHQPESFSNYNIKIYDTNETYFYLSPWDNKYVDEVESGEEFSFGIYHRIQPKPSFHWYKLGNASNGLKHVSEKIPYTKNYLHIHSKPIESGVYVLNATYGNASEILEFDVRIVENPVKMKMRPALMLDNYTDVTCEIKPKQAVSEVLWELMECTLSSYSISCNETGKRTYKSETDHAWDEDDDEKNEEKTYKKIFNFKVPSLVSCDIKTYGGVVIGTAKKLFAPSKIEIVNFMETRKIARGENIEIACVLLAADEGIMWYQSESILGNESNIEIIALKTEYTLNAVLKIKSIQDFNSGDYECRGIGSYERKHINIKVHDPIDPSIVQTNLDEGIIEVRLDESLDLECLPNKAIPVPSVEWYKNGVGLHENENLTLKMSNTKLSLSHIKREDEGIYQCVVSNNFGKNASAAAKLTIMRSQGLSLGWIMAIVLFVFVLSAIVAFLVARYMKKNRQLLHLKNLLREKPEDGSLNPLNPEVPLLDQVDLLPYDRRYDFSRKNLIFGMKLGSGSFGEVFQAWTVGIKPDEKETMVAVKRIKKKVDDKDFMDLIFDLVSELKILIHLGKHPNIVNLLGAVTENISKGDLMVIVENCEYGSVRNFLTENRASFINQINLVTKKIDGKISSKLKDMPPMEVFKDQTAAGIATIKEKSNIGDITTTDLVNWACQVARGMDYLVSKKVLHRDLAARNILLCSKDLVKICDFGLARKMVQTEYHRKLPDAYLPIPWMALESLTDHVFTKYSEVWSFGIMLWEFFSLGQIPYSGKKLDNKFLKDLSDGYRLEKPAYANDELYAIMRNCWLVSETTRPLFDQLERDLSLVLESKSTNENNLRDVDVTLAQKDCTNSAKSLAMPFASPSDKIPFAKSPTPPLEINSLKDKSPTKYTSMTDFMHLVSSNSSGREFCDTDIGQYSTIEECTPMLKEAYNSSIASDHGYYSASLLKAQTEPTIPTDCATTTES